MIADQATLELKLDKLEQIKVNFQIQFLLQQSCLLFSLQTLIQNLEAYADLKQDLKQLESKVSIISLNHSYNQYIDKRKQLLSNAQVCFYLFYLKLFKMKFVFIGCIDASIGSS